jgi:hypothetical protein
MAIRMVTGTTTDIMAMDIPTITGIRTIMAIRTTMGTATTMRIRTSTASR